MNNLRPIDYLILAAILFTDASHYSGWMSILMNAGGIIMLIFTFMLQGRSKEGGEEI